jgi:hypothetical protein
MKLTNSLVEKFGTDKLLHFLVTAWLVSEVKIFGISAVIIVFIFIIILGFIKELILDNQFDTKDIIASFIGGLISLLLYLIL